MAAICVYSAFSIHRVIEAGAPPAVAFPLGTADRDVTYCGEQTLDVFIPRIMATHPLPLAIFVHGGGLVAGDKGYLSPVFLDALAGAGYAVASVDYRLAPMAKFPAQIEDVKCAIRFLRAQARTLGLDSRHFFAFGTSYGGLLVALAALTGDEPVFESGPNRDQSSAIGAAVDMFGPANLPGWISPSDLQKLFGGDESELVTASPTHYAHAGAPPMLIIQGEADTTVPESQSVQLYDHLTRFGDPTQLVLVRNMGHMFTQVGPRPIDPSLPQLAQDVVSFFDQARAVE
jgi:acetyl esterase/lipase